jgi:hypothetical protein
MHITKAVICVSSDTNMSEARRLIVTAIEYAIVKVEEKSENCNLMGCIGYCSMPMITKIPQSKLQGLNQTQVKKWSWRQALRKLSRCSCLVTRLQNTSYTKTSHKCFENIAGFKYLGKQTNSMAWVRKRTIPAERPPLVGEVSANFCEQRVRYY